MRYESDSDDEQGEENGIGAGDDDDEDDAFSDVNRPAGKLDFRIEEDVGRVEKKRRERERRRDKERLRDWEEEVEEISRSVGLFGLVSRTSTAIESLTADTLPDVHHANRSRNWKACVYCSGPRLEIAWIRF